MHGAAAESHDPRRGRAFGARAARRSGSFRTRESGLHLAVGVHHRDRHRRRGHRHRRRRVQRRVAGGSRRWRSPSSSPTTGPTPADGLASALVEGTLERAARRRLRRDRARTSATPPRTSGATPTRGPGFSLLQFARCGSACSNSSRAPPGSRAMAFPPRLTGGLRGPLVLGHRDLRAPVPDLHAPPPRPVSAPARYPCWTPRGGGPGSWATAARCSPGARSTVKRPRRNYAAGTAQYHLNADIAYASSGTSSSHRRPRPSYRDAGGRCWSRPRGSGPTWVFSPNKKGDASYQRCHRARRVLDGRGQQHLHEPDGAREPRGGGGEGRGARPRPSTGAFEAAHQGDRPPRRTALLARARPTHVHPLRRGPAPPQDDGFLDREPWDFEGHPAESLSPAPALPPAGDLSPPGDQAGRRDARGVPLGGRSSRAEAKRRMFEYYDPITTGDSSLSRERFRASWRRRSAIRVATEEYLVDAATIDLCDTAGNVPGDGIHVRVRRRRMAGARSSASAVCATHDGELRFAPRLPADVGPACASGSSSAASGSRST